MSEQSSVISPDWVRIPKTGQYLEGLSRTHIFNLALSGKVKSVMLSATGQKSGIRLINLPDLRRWITEQSEKQIKKDSSVKEGK